MRKLKALIIIAIGLMAASLAEGRGVIMPPPLQPGSKIAIVTPASAIDDAIIDTAVSRLKARGYQTVVYPHARGHEYGTFATTDTQRAAELMDAFADPEIDAILCSRGGYGTVRLLPLLNADIVRNNPKWLIGYSDISCLHAFMHHAGIASIHGPMAAHLAEEPDTIPSTEYLFQALTAPEKIIYNVDSHAYNKPGWAKGRLIGGNLLTINGLSDTQYDILNLDDDTDYILFFEDVDEKIHAIERVLMRLHYSGALSRMKGIVIGQFTEYKPTADFPSMEAMIHNWLLQWGYYNEANPTPIVYNFPTGHIVDNYPMICGAEAELVVTPYRTSLGYTGR